MAYQEGGDGEGEMSGEETVACLLEAFEDEDRDKEGFIGCDVFVRLLAQILSWEDADEKLEQVYNIYASPRGFDYRKVFANLKGELEKNNEAARRMESDEWKATDVFNHFISGRTATGTQPLPALLEEFRRAQQEYNQVQKQVDAFNGEVDKDQQTLRSAENDYDENQEGVATIRFLVQEGRENVRFLEKGEASQDNIVATKENAEGRISEIERELENEKTLHSEAEKLKEALQSSGKSTQQSLEQLRTLRNRTTRRRRDIADRTGNNVGLKGQLTKLKGQAENDKQQVREQKKTLMESAQKLEKQNQQLQGQQRKFKKRQREVEARHSQVLLEASKIAADNANRQKQITVLIQEAKKLREQKKRGDAMKKKFGQLRAEKRKMEDEKERLLRGMPPSSNVAFHKAREEIDTQVQTIGRERQHVAKQAHAFSLQTRKVQEATRKVSEEQLRIRQYRRDLTKSQRDIDDLKDKIRKGESKLAKMRKYDAAEAEAEQAIQQQMIDRLRAEVDSLSINYQVNEESATEQQKESREESQRARKEKRTAEMKLKTETAKQEADKEIVQMETVRTKARRRQVDDDWSKVTNELSRQTQQLREVEEKANEVDMLLRSSAEEQQNHEFDIANTNIEVDSVKAEKEEIVRFRAEVEKNAEVSLDQLKEWEEERNRLIKAKEEQAEANKALSTTTKTEGTWFDTCRKELDKVDIEKTHFAREKRKLETEKSRLMDLERKLRLKKVSVLTLKQEVEESGRTLAALKYDVNKESLALKQARGATNKMKSLLQQDVAEFRVYQAAKKATDEATDNLNNETSEKNNVGKDLQTARDKYEFQRKIFLEEEDIVTALSTKVKNESLRIRQLEDDYDNEQDTLNRMKLEMVNQREELSCKKLEINNQTSDCHRMQEELAEEKIRIAEEKKAWLEGLIAEERNKLKKLQQSRDRKRRRLDGMNSDLENFDLERLRIMEEMRALGIEAKDWLKRRKKLVSQHKSLIIVREEFNAENIDKSDDSGSYSSQYAVLLRTQIERMRKEVQKLLDLLMMGKNTLEKEREEMSNLRQRLLTCQNIKQEMGRRDEINKERTNLNDERRKVIESKKKLRKIIQLVVQEKQMYEKNKRNYVEAKDMREIAEMKHDTDMQTHNKQVEALNERMDYMDERKEEIDDYIYTYGKDFDDLNVRKQAIRKGELNIFKWVDGLHKDREGVVERIGAIEERCTICKDLLKETIKGPPDPNEMDSDEEEDDKQPKYVVQGPKDGFVKKVNGVYKRKYNIEGDYYFYECENDYGTFTMYSAEDEVDDPSAEPENVWWISASLGEDGEEIDYYSCTSSNPNPPKGPWYLEDEDAERRGMKPGPFMLTKKDMSHIVTGERELFPPPEPMTNEHAEPEDLVCGKGREFYNEREVDAEQCHLDTEQSLRQIGKGTQMARHDMHLINKDLDEFEGMFRVIKTERDDHEEKCNFLKEELELLHRELRALKRQKSTLLFRKTMSRQRLQKKKAKLKEQRRKVAEKKRLAKIEAEKQELVKQKLRDLERLEKEKSSELEYLIESHLPFDKATGEVRMEIASIIADFFEGLEPMMQKLLDDILFMAAEKIEKEHRLHVAASMQIERDPEEEAQWAELAGELGDGGEAFDADFDMENWEEAIDPEEADFGDIMRMVMMSRSANQKQEAVLAGQIALFTPFDGGYGGEDDGDDELAGLLGDLMGTGSDEKAAEPEPAAPEPAAAEPEPVAEEPEAQDDAEDDYEDEEEEEGPAEEDYEDAQEDGEEDGEDEYEDDDGEEDGGDEDYEDVDDEEGDAAIDEEGGI